jgi:hypothetical protein
MKAAYRAGVIVALLTSFLTVWTTVVRDDGTGMAYFLLIMAAAVGGFAAWFHAAGMARTMFGVAVMQALLGVATATSTSTASVPGGPVKALVFSGVFTALWLTSTMFFRTAASSGRARGAKATER